MQTRIGSTDQHTGIYRCLLAVITVSGALLRLYGLWSRPIDFDEGATRYFAALPLGDLWGAPARLELNPPLFYTIEHFVTRIAGGSEGTLRLAAVSAGTGCIVVAAAIARLVAGNTAGLIAAALVATSAVCVGASQDARAYSSLTLAALLAVHVELVLLRIYRDPARGRHDIPWAAWASYLLASVAALYLHGTAVLMIVALNLAALFSWLGPLGHRRDFAWHWLMVNGAVLCLFAFWLPVILFQSEHALADFWIAVPTLTDLRFAVMNVYAQPFIHAAQPAADLLFLAAGFLGIVLYRNNRALTAMAVLVLLGVPAMSWAISQWRPIMNGKTLLWLAPVFLVFVALGAARLRAMLVPVTLLLLGVQITACVDYFHDRWDEGFASAAAMLRADARDGDVLYLDPPSQEVLLAYYGWRADRMRIYAPDRPDLWFRSFVGGRCPASQVAARFGHEARVWVLIRAKPAEQSAIAAGLAASMDEVSDDHFGSGRLRGVPMRNLELSQFVTRHP